MRHMLDETGNLVRLFNHAAGKSEVPATFIAWSGLSLIAACVADRVWIEKFRGSRLAPNLFVMLIGPSGLGKNVAIDMATRYVRDIPVINFYRGKATYAHLIDRLGKPYKTLEGKRVLANPKLFLVTPELALSVGSGQLAEELVKLMTELYTGSADVFMEGTRMHGLVTIENGCINWLAGTTKEWMIRCIPRDAIEAGFLGRVVTVEADYDFDTRIEEPEYPPDYDEVTEHIAARVRALTHANGEFVWEPEARDMKRHWYRTRPAPEHEAVYPWWKRSDDLLLKLCMVFSLADDCDLVIRTHHFKHARERVEELSKSVPRAIQFVQAKSSVESEQTHRVADVLQSAKQLQHSALLRRSGLTAKQMRDALDTLIQRGQVIRMQNVLGRGQAYKWTDGKRKEESGQ